MYKSILVPVALGGEGIGRNLIEKAKKLLADGGSITIVHVMEEIPGYVAASIPREKLANRRKEAMTKMEAIGSAARGIKVEYDVRSGNAPNNILNAAKESEADLIIIGSHSPGLQDYFIGSTAARVVRHAQCSVLVSR
ncbi:universal stress protein [Alkalilacustris brevis]|uniref:universal stress protein n=1 Tax=Alkalilacustris brevis TaxID=2026338 RepID=UPI000E0D9C9D|nr:universal stress protein [Alkalilacustris brevis]